MSKAKTYQRQPYHSSAQAESRLRDDIRAVESYLETAESHAKRIRATRDELLAELRRMTGERRRKAAS